MPPDPRGELTVADVTVFALIWCQVELTSLANLNKEVFGPLVYSPA
jgi:hypothetical protein